MKVTWRAEWPLWALLLAMFALAAITWSHAPDRIPVHWGPNGQVDRFGGKFEGLLLLPLVGLVIYLLFLLLPRIDPARANYAHFWGAYTVFRIAILAFLAVVYGIIHLWIRGHHTPIETVVPVLVGGLFVVLGGVMGRLRPNWFIGIRTPWTLSSRRSWTEAHKAAGWVFSIAGVVLIVAGALRSIPMLIGAIVFMGVGVLATVVYSYFLWRDDPEKTPLAGAPR